MDIGVARPRPQGNAVTPGSYPHRLMQRKHKNQP